MITIRSMRTLGLLALAAVIAALMTSTAAARPDPEGLRGPSLADSGQVAAAELRRPTGPAEHAILGGPSSASETGQAGATRSRPLAAAQAATKDGFDYLAAGIGALAVAAALGLAAGTLSTRRRRRVGAAV